jgi:hypothetical protein
VAQLAGTELTTISPATLDLKHADGQMWYLAQRAHDDDSPPYSEGEGVEIW